MGNIVLCHDAPVAQVIDASAKVTFSRAVELKGGKILKRALLYVFHRTEQACLLEGEAMPINDASARTVTLELRKEDLVYPGILEAHVMAQNSDGTTQRYPGQGILRISVAGETRRYELGMLTRAIEEAMKFRNEAETFSRAKADGTVVQESSLPSAKEHENEIWFVVSTRQYYESDGSRWGSVGTATAGITSDGELADIPVARVTTIADMQAIRPTPRMHRIVESYSYSSQSGGGLFKWVPGDTTPADGGLVFESVANGYRPGEIREGRWHRLWDGQNMQLGWFGAREEAASAVADNDDALERALATAPDHARLMLGGRYHVGSEHRVRAPVTIANGKFAIDVSDDLSRLFDVQSSQVHFEDVRFDGLGNDVRRVIELANHSADCSIVGCAFENIHSTWFVRAVCTSTVGCTNFIVDRCIFRNLTAVADGTAGNDIGECRAIQIGQSATIPDDPPTSARLTNCYFEDIPDREDGDAVRTMALDDERGMHVLIEGNMFVDIGKRAVKAQSKRTIVQNNVIFGDLEALALESINIQCDDCQVSNNEIYGRFEFGVTVEQGSENVLVEGNTIELTPDHSEYTFANAAPLRVRSSSSVVLRSNKCTGGRVGIALSAEEGATISHLTVEGNVVRKVFQAGLQFRTLDPNAEINHVLFRGNVYERLKARVVWSLGSTHEGSMHHIHFDGDVWRDIRYSTGAQFTHPDTHDITMKNIIMTFEEGQYVANPVYFADVKRVLIQGCQLVTDNPEGWFARVDANSVGSLGNLRVVDCTLSELITTVFKDFSGGNATNVTESRNHIWE